MVLNPFGFIDFVYEYKKRHDKKNYMVQNIDNFVDFAHHSNKRNVKMLNKKSKIKSPF